MSLSKLRETTKDREAWCATVHGVAKSQAWQSDWSTMNRADINICVQISVWTHIFNSHVCISRKVISRLYGKCMFYKQLKGPFVYNFYVTFYLYLFCDNFHKSWPIFLEFKKLRSCHLIYHFMANRWGKSGNSGRSYLFGLQNHCGWWLQPLN